MRKSIIVLFFLFLNNFVTAQNVSVAQAVENIGDGYNMAYRVFVPHTNVKLLQESWVQFLKDNKSKVKVSKSGINGRYTVIQALGQDTITVFSRMFQQPDGVQLVVAFQRGETFISTTTSPRDATYIEQILHDFAMKGAQDGINEKVKNQNSLIQAGVKEQNSLNRNNTFLASENQKMKLQIAANDTAIVKNNARLEFLKTFIASQNLAIDSLKNKSTELR